MMLVEVHTMARQIRLSQAEKDILISPYERTTSTVDDLPYTDDFETLFIEFIARSGKTMTRHDVWRALSSQRKAGRLVRKER